MLKKAQHQLTKNGIGLLVIHEDTQKVCTILGAQQSHKKFGTISLDEIEKKQYRFHRKKPWMF